MTQGLFSSISALLRADSPRDALAGSQSAIQRWLTPQSLALLGLSGAWNQDDRLSLGAQLNQPAAGSHAGQRWKFKYSIDAGGLRCSEVDYTPQAGEMAGMTERVLEHVEWSAPQLKLTAPIANVLLPQDPRFLIAHGLFREGKVNQRAGSSGVVWPLESTHDCSALFVFGYLIVRDPVHPVQAIPADIVSAPDFMERINGLGHAFAFVISELVLCRPKIDFDPFGGSSAARCYPVGSVWVSEAADIDWNIKLARPALSTMASMDHAMVGMEPQGAIRCGLFTDRNEPLGTVGGLPLPFWSNLFAYYNTGRDLGVSNRRFSAVTAQGARVFDQGPEALDAPIHRPSRRLRKVDRQGAYDNVHMAPSKMHTLSNGQPARIFMAPVCQHDCFHMHWRWASDFSAESVRGWSRSGPNTADGAVMVPLNQTVDIEVGAGPEFTYFARAHGQGTGAWAVFFHHGAAYVDSTSVTVA